jgi:hypothetical protein
MTEPAPPDDPDLIAWVRAGCSCSETVLLISDEHVDACPVARTNDLTIGWYAVRRHGSPKRQGGPGVKWVCSCGGEQKSKYNATGTCRHVRALFAGNVVEVDDPRDTIGKNPVGKGAYFAKLTAYGDDVLRADWAAKALRDKP